jgi:pantothenate synthetase
MHARSPLALLQLRHASHLGEVSDTAQQPTLLAVAAWFPSKDSGTVRLIDNTVLGELCE